MPSAVSNDGSMPPTLSQRIEHDDDDGDHDPSFHCLPAPPRVVTVSVASMCMTVLY